MMRISLLVICTICAAVLVACGKSPTASPGQRHATIRIPAAGPGPQHQLEVDLSDAARIALREMGGKVAGVSLALTAVSPGVSDAESEGSAAYSDAAGAASEDPKTLAWLGNWGSNSTAVVLPKLNQAGVVAVSPGATATSLTNTDSEFPGAPDKYFPDQARFGRTFLRVVPDDRVIAKVAAAELARRGIKRVYTADDGDTEGISWSSATSSAAVANGLTVVGHKTLNDPVADAPVAISEAVTNHAQAVLWGSPVGAGAEAIWRAAARAGSLAMVAGPAVYGSQTKLLEAVKRGTLLFTPVLPPEMLSAKVAREQERYSKIAGRDLLPGSLNSAAALQVLAAAISLAAKTDGPAQSGGSLRSQTADALHQIGTVETVIGPIRFDRYGNPVSQPVGLWQLVGDRFVFVGRR